MKKQFLILLILLISLVSKATVYYVSNAGNDSNNGTSTSTSWQTLAKVKATAFVAGDQILLKCNDVWNEWFNFGGSGTVGSRIIVSSYGSGVKPEIRGWGEVTGWTASGNWSLYSTGIYRMAQATSFKRLWINGVEKKESQTLLTLSDDFPWRFDTGYLYVKSNSNPATVFTSLINGIGQWSTANIVGKSNFTIDGLKFTGGTNSMRLENNVNFTIQNCEIGYRSNSYGMWIVSSGSVSTDNAVIVNNVLDTDDELFYNYYRGYHATDDGIYLGQGAINCKIHNNYFKGWSHTGIALVSINSTSVPFHDHDVYNNFITAPIIDYARGFEVDYLTNGYNIKVHDNTVHNTSVRNQINGNGLRFYNNIIDLVRGCPYPQKPQVGNGLSLEGYATPAINMDIYSNVITRCNDSGILVTWTNTNEVANNNIHDNNVFECGTTYNYQLQIDPTSAVMHNNIYANNHLFKTGASNLVYYRPSSYTVLAFNLITPVRNDVVSGNDAIITFDIPSFGIKTTPLSELRIEHNATGNSKTVTLDYPSYSTAGTRYTTTVTIPAYSSMILLKDVTPAYFVSTDGNDLNDGLSEETPWQTLSKVNSTTFSPGDKILFRRGDTFYGSLTIDDSGTYGNPITFGAYGTGANPTITGFTSVTAWSNLGSSIWESSSAVSALDTCNMVTVNDINASIGRYPNSNAANGGYLTFQSHSGNTSITSNSLTGTPNWTGAEVVIHTGHFIIDRELITSQSGGTLNFNALSSGYYPEDGYGFFIQNDTRTLDVQNEWYYNPTTHKIRIYSLSQPINVKVASVEKTIIVNANYLKFENITFTGTNGATFYNWDQSPRWNNLTISNCQFQNIGASAVNTLTNYLTVENCTFKDINTNAISTSYGNNISMLNNDIENIGIMPGMRTTSYFGSNSTVDCATVSGLVFDYNAIKNVGYNGISFYGDSIRIRNNYIDNFCNVLDDGGGIYTFTGTRTPMDDVIISNNVILNSLGSIYGTGGTPTTAVGVYLDERSKNVEVSNNSIANMVDYGIFLNTSAGNINVHHNTVYNASSSQYYSTYWGTETPISPPVGNQVNNNIFVAKTKDTQWDDAPQKCISFYFTRADATPANDLMLASTTLDNNYYARPISQTEVVRFNHLDWNPGFQTLEQWKTYSGQDLHSNGSPKSITSVNDLAFVYNETNTAKIVNIPFVGIDITGKRYTGYSTTLQPYTSLVLIEDVISWTFGQGNKQWKF